MRAPSSLPVRAVALVGAFVLSGCYTYVPATSVAPGSDVRVLLPVESRRAGGTVIRETLAVEGTLVSWDDTLRVATETTQQVGNFRQVQQMDTLRVPASEVDAVELREFSRGRTLGLTAAIVGGAALLVTGISQAAGGSDDGGGNGNGTSASITVGRFLDLLRAIGGRE
jgi:hypothetical protein